MREYLVFLLLGTMWGGSFVGIKYALAGFPSLSAAAIRVGISLFFLHLLFTVQKRQKTFPSRLTARVWLAGFFMQAVPFGLLFWSEQNVSAGFAGIMNGTVPLWTFLMSHLLTPRQEPTSVRTKVGIAIGLTGMLIMYVPKLSLGTSPREVLGMLGVLGVAVSYAIGNLLTRQLLRTEKIDFYANCYQQHVVSFVFLLLTSLVAYGVPGYPSPEVRVSSTVALLYLGIFSSAVAWLIYFHLMREWGAVKASTVTYLVPPLALLLDYLFFAVIPSAGEMVGALSIFAGVMLVQVAPKNPVPVTELSPRDVPSTPP